jgi:hypothetical protein
MDGSVRMVSPEVSHETWKIANTLKGNGVLGADW